MERATINKIFTFKVLIPFYDMDNDNIKRLRNEEFDCLEKRAKEILNHELTLVEIISIIIK